MVAVQRKIDKVGKEGRESSLTLKVDPRDSLIVVEANE